ncbi:MAG: Fe-S cluster assembly protein SufD [Cyclobacteriaceae bacterium]|nr:Fe-S cluster assembly protein SufD [Cyclobacteriaceae bacterium]
MTHASVHNEILDTLAASAMPVNSLQQQALQEFIRLGLPGPKNEEYKHTPISRVLEKSINPSLPFQSEGKVPDEKLWKLNSIPAYQVVFLNGKFVAKQSQLPQGIDIIPMHTARDLQVVSDHLGKYADFKSDSFTAWNTAAWTDGIFINIPEDYTVDTPIILYYLHDATAGQVKSITRNLIIAGKNSKVTIVEKWFTQGSDAVISNTVSEILLREKTSVNHVVVQTDDSNHIQYLHNQFWQEAESLLNSYVITLSGMFIRNNTRVALDGACESHLYGLYLLKDNAFTDNHTVVDHRKPNAFSNELYKGVLDGKSNGVFNGKIYVRQGAQKTNAFQSNRNLLLSDQAVAHTKPQLEIWADDVKCSHGCTVGQLDEDALFYLRARGIDKETAKAMLLYAFAAEVIETLPHDGIKNFLDTLIRDRLHNSF